MYQNWKMWRLLLSRFTQLSGCRNWTSYLLCKCYFTTLIPCFNLFSVQVVKTAYNEVNKRLQYVGKVPITVEKHTKCKCQCKVKAEVVHVNFEKISTKVVCFQDCTAYQEYRESECRCVCKNIDEERKCYKNSGVKLWNPDLCSCECREIQPCSTGFEFDLNECRCIQSQLRRRYILNAKEQPDS